MTKMRLLQRPTSYNISIIRYLKQEAIVSNVQRHG